MTPEYAQAKSDYEVLRDKIIAKRRADEEAAGILRDIKALKTSILSDFAKGTTKAKRRAPVKRAAPWEAPEPRRSTRDRKFTSYKVSFPYKQLTCNNHLSSSRSITKIQQMRIIKHQGPPRRGGPRRLPRSPRLMFPRRTATQEAVSSKVAKATRPAEA